MHYPLENIGSGEPKFPYYMLSSDVMIPELPSLKRPSKTVGHSGLIDMNVSVEV